MFTLSACEIWREFVVDVKKIIKREGKEEKPQEWNKCSIAIVQKGSNEQAAHALHYYCVSNNGALWFELLKWS